MRQLISAAASALALGAVMIAPAAIAQENKDRSDETVDYSEDPSYQAARDFFRGLGADQPREPTQEDIDKEVEDFIEAWPGGSKVDHWEHHYLILEGENYLPVIWSAVTEYVTLFAIQDGYMPSGGMGGKTASETNCYGSHDYRVTADGIVRGGTSLSVAKADEAATGGIAGQNKKGTADNTYNCPRLVGDVSAGTQVMDKDHNVLAEQWFEEGIKAFVADGLIWDDDYISPEDEAAFGKVEFLVVTQGGGERTDDPAIQRLPASTMVVIDYPIQRRAGEEGGDKTESAKKKKPYIPGAAELPIKVGYEYVSGDHNADGVIDAADVAEIRDRIDDKITREDIVGDTGDTDVLDASGDGIIDHADISDILKALEDKMDDVLSDAEGNAEFLLVHRADPELMQNPLMEDEIMQRIRKIRERSESVAGS